jgi:hypothetical protein
MIFILPFLMYFLGKLEYYNDGRMMVEWSFLIPVAVFILIAAMKALSYKLRNTSIPIPDERFTRSEFNKVYIEKSRWQELVLYMNDLEDWMERKGLM